MTTVTPTPTPTPTPATTTPAATLTPATTAIATTLTPAMTTTPATTPTPAWQAFVYMPESYSDEAKSFLDAHAQKGKLSKTGNFRLLENIGACVPYELCPPRVKRILQKITDDGDLPRTAFPRSSAYQTALINLHTYGYLKNIDKGLSARKAARRAYHQKWQRQNKDKMQRYNRNATKYRLKWKAQQIELKALAGT
jgi:hypothetical protein